VEVTEALVRHVAGLARIDLSEAEVSALLPQLARILGYVEQVREIPCAEDPATQEPVGLETLRADVEGAVLDRRDLIRNAPAHDGAFLVVPRFFEED
jgi:aspartyl-tRNA(Asn)/glutamyl-tRNA(Gln) amidotransferase subunit C